jgi:hypothetical protein
MSEQETDLAFEQLRRERDTYRAAYEMADRAVKGQLGMLADALNRAQLAEARLRALQEWANE